MVSFIFKYEKQVILGSTYFLNLWCDSYMTPQANLKSNIKSLFSGQEKLTIIRNLQDTVIYYCVKCCLNSVLNNLNNSYDNLDLV